MRVRLVAGVFLLIVWAAPVSAKGDWQTILIEKGKRVEMERSSVAREPSGAMLARARVVLEVGIVDVKTSTPYRIVEALFRFDCTARTYTTLGRAYYKEEGELLRPDEVRNTLELPVHSGSQEDRMLREVCRPRSGSEAMLEAQRTVDDVGKAAEELRQANQVLFEKEISKAAGAKTTHGAAPVDAGRKAEKTGKSAKTNKQAEATPYAGIPWAYEGSGGPDNWSKIRPEYAVCSSGKRQSPIDLRDGIAVDLDTLPFAYRAAPFRVVDEGHTLRIAVNGGSVLLLGKTYDLAQIRFHRPSETTIEGRSFEMEAQLMHKSDDGKFAVVSVLFEKSLENGVIQTVLNNLPLEKGGEFSPPSQTLDASGLLPQNRRYYTFLGSLTTPPCTEEVLWVVFKQPITVSAEQVAIFQRLYPPNVRATQPGWGRIIKESR